VAVETTVAAPRPGGTFRAFSYSGYRYLWMGQVGHAASLWMEQVVRPLLILELTGSAVQVGLVVAVRMVPVLLFGVVAGAVADRYNKKLVLMYCQAVTLSMHLLLGVLLLSDLIQTWHVFATAVVSGSAMAFNQPARQALLPRLVPRDDLLNALALNTAAMNVMRIGGAGLAGVLLLAFDYGEVYLLNVIIYGWVMWNTWRIQISEHTAPVEERESLLGDLKEGFRYVGRNRNVLYLVGMAMILFVFGLPYQGVFVPLLAIEELGIGRSGAGWMLAVTGAGALVVSLGVASRGTIARRGLVMTTALAAFSVALILLAQSPWLALSIFALLLTGGLSIMYMALNNTLLLEQTTPEFHGRVMSLMSLDRGLIPVGAILGGVLAEVLGPKMGLTVMASVCFSLTALLFLLVPLVRRMQ
jgi:MFS family permease